MPDVRTVESIRLLFEVGDKSIYEDAAENTAVLLAEIDRLTNENDLLIQITAELCDHCGWRMVFPGSPCKNCGK